MTKIEKTLQFTCPTCFATFKLLEIKEKLVDCEANCSQQWQALLTKHYQECIILHLAQKEAQEANHD